MGIIDSRLTSMLLIIDNRKTLSPTPVAGARAGVAPKRTETMRGQNSRRSRPATLAAGFVEILTQADMGRHRPGAFPVELSL